MGSQRVGHDLATAQQQLGRGETLVIFFLFLMFIYFWSSCILVAARGTFLAARGLSPVMVRGLQSP